jgi:hypothetical protein
MFYSAYSEKHFVPGVHDANSSRVMSWLFRPNVWQAGTVYIKNDDDNYAVVIPTEFTGLYYKVKNSGKSGATEPTWVMVPDQTTSDGTKGLVWLAENYNLMDVAVNVTGVEYITTHGVTVSSTAYTNNTSTFKIDPLPAAAIAAGTFEITSRVTTSGGTVFDATMVFKVGDR